MIEDRAGNRTYPFSDGLSALDSTLHVALALFLPGVGVLGERVELLHNLFLVCLEVGPINKHKRGRVSESNEQREVEQADEQLMSQPDRQGLGTELAEYRDGSPVHLHERIVVLGYGTLQFLVRGGRSLGHKNVCY